MLSIPVYLQASILYCGVLHGAKDFHDRSGSGEFGLCCLQIRVGVRVRVRLRGRTACWSASALRCSTSEAYSYRVRISLGYDARAKGGPVDPTMPPSLLHVMPPATEVPACYAGLDGPASGPALLVRPFVRENHGQSSCRGRGGAGNFFSLHVVPVGCQGEG